MNISARRSASSKVVLVLLMITLCTLLVGPGVQAQGPAARDQAPSVVAAGPWPGHDVVSIDPDSARLAGTTPQSSPNTTHHVGAEWVNTFPTWPDGNRDAWDDSCEGLYFTVPWSGFLYFENSVWETDFKAEDLGGHEDSYIDTADLAIVCTHGGRVGSDGSAYTALILPTNKDDRRLSAADAYRSYGDGQLEWLAFDSCDMLARKAPVAGAPAGNLGKWHDTFNGLHLLLGFKNEMHVIEPGDGLLWGMYMTGMLGAPASVTQGWFWAVDYVQPGDVCARVVAEVMDNYNDYLWGYGYVSPDPTYNGRFYYWSHCSQESGLLQAQTVEQIITMPVLQVVSRTVDPAYVAAIDQAFGIEGNIYQNGRFYYTVDPTGTRVLLVDIPSGGFVYHDLAQLVVPPTVTPTLPTWDQASTIASTFFRGAGAELPGVTNRGPYTYGVDEITAEDQVSVSGALTDQTVAVTATNGTLAYARDILVPVGTASGPQSVQVPIVGAGARLLVYFGDGGEIIGMQGGTRDVQTTGMTVTVMTADEAWTLYQANPRIAVAQVSLPTDVLTRTVETLGYYEQPHWDAQAELIPVWIFTVLYGPTETADIYVPAAVEYMPPQVQIDTPTPGTVIVPGQEITMTGSVAQYGKPPFTYSWTSGSGPLGSGASIVASLGPVIKANGLYSQTISLDVTDANGQHGTATTMVFVQAAIYLPIISR